MNNILHYFFGEIEFENTSKVFPEKNIAIKKFLDSWLPALIQTPNEVFSYINENDKETCEYWRSNHIRDKVGIISIPFGSDNDKVVNNDLYHIIIHLYFNTATAGRISRTGHAMFLSKKLWRMIEYNPFVIQPLVNKSAEFDNFLAILTKISYDYKLNQDNKANKRLRYLLQQNKDKYRYISNNINKFLYSEKPVLFDGDTPQWMYELILLSLPEAIREKIYCWSGYFAAKSAYQICFHMGRLTEQKTSHENIQPDITRLFKDVVENNFDNYRDYVKKNNYYHNPNSKLWDELKINNFKQNNETVKKKEIPHDYKISKKSKSFPPKKKAISIISKIPKKTILVLLTSIIILCTYLWVNLILWQSKIDKWMDVYNKERNDIPYTLLIEANNYIKARPIFANVIILKKPINTLEQIVSSKILEAISIKTLERVHSCINDLYSIIKLDQLNDIGFNLNVQSNINRLYDIEKNIIDYYDFHKTRQRRLCIDNLKKLYKERNIPSNPHLTKLEETTILFEAQHLFNNLSNKWEEKINKHSLQLIEFKNNITLFRNQYKDILSDKLNGLEYKFYNEYEKKYRKLFIEEYNSFKKNYVNYSKDMFINIVQDYQNAINEIPSNIMLSFIDVNNIKSTILNDKIVCIRIKSNSLIVSQAKFCIDNNNICNDRPKDLRLYDNNDIDIRIKWTYSRQNIFIPKKLQMNYLKEKVEKTLKYKQLLDEKRITFNKSVSLNIEILWPIIK